MKLSLLFPAAVAMGVFAMGSLQADESAPQRAQGAEVERTDPSSGRDVVAHNVNRGGERIDVEDFIEEASAKGIAEVETAKLALEKGSPHIQEFAQRMIDDHTAANRELADIATSEGIEVSDEATLLDRSKAMILRVRDGESFDEAYVNNQILAHKQTIELFERGAHVENSEISQFAEKTLPKLKEHLERANELKGDDRTAEAR